MTIEINNRLYNDFVLWAKANNMSDEDIPKYIEKAFRDKFNLDRYGDLNEKLHKNRKPESINEPKNELNCEPINEPIPDKNEPKSEQINEQISEQINEQINEVVSEAVSEDVNEDVNGDKTEEITEEIKPVKPKRKTKVIPSN